VNVIALAEIQHGIELMSASRQRARLAQWVTEELPLRFEDRVLAIDPPVADAWGVVMARSQKAGLSLGAMDAFTAATAETHGLTLVTRNVKDFGHVGIPLLGPWQRRL
jgi:predicted nucleic acid-binding protein